MTFACKCDLDTSSVNAFFTRLGLPMYLEANHTKEQLTMRNLLDMSDCQLEAAFGIHNATHLRTISIALNCARSFI